MALYCDDPVPGIVQDICANEASRITAVAFIRSDNEKQSRKCQRRTLYVSFRELEWQVI